MIDCKNLPPGVLMRRVATPRKLLSQVFTLWVGLGFAWGNRERL